MLGVVRRAAKSVLPKSTVYRLKRQISQNRFENYAQKKLDMNFRQVNPGAIPPPELIAKTAALKEADVQIQSCRDVYLETGYYSVLRLFKILEHFSINLRTIGSVLEFGCGTARLLRHFRYLNGVRLVGSDVNIEMIEWCQKNITGIEFYHNQLTPPLSFAENNSFDLILASSVFTHIPLDTQELWLQEMQRILRPGGIFICSVLGHNHTSLILGNAEQTELDCTGSYTLTSEDSQATYSTKVGGSAWDVFQTRAEVIKVFGQYFQIVDYIPGGQDFLVLHKPNPAVPMVMNAAPFPAEKI